MLKYKIIGFLLILLAIGVIGISFGIFFLGFHIYLGNSDISPIIIKVINFAIITIFFVYIAYMGYIMIFSSREK
ncbi:hypothetical protein [Acidianus manzaensis]|uniref:Oxidase n=1 Tax=Acidianus manzaensis TaxID=282676 RepID=A0A1W6JX45_9CREN|nr:hypothetical protein [Acidianus manzaensis]ARM74856.1 hypothetical protein B6F84_01645 [Acidianus manzaensis]